MKGKILKLLAGALLTTTVLTAGLVMGPEAVKADDHSGCDISEWQQGYDNDDRFDGNYGGKHIKICNTCSTDEHKVVVDSHDAIPDVSDVCTGFAPCSVEGCTVRISLASPRHNYAWVTETCSETGRTYKVQKCSKCNEYNWDTQTFVEEKKTEKKKSESSSSSSSSKQSTPALTPAQQAKVTEQAQAVVGSTAYTAKQAEVQKSITTAVASVAQMTPAQVAAVSQTGVPVSLGGCTTLDRTTAATMARNSSVPYNMMFNWNGVTFSVKIPAGANYMNLVDAKGDIQMWRLVQAFGISNAVLAK